jgi:DNA relaxase NicK
MTGWHDMGRVLRESEKRYRRKETSKRIWNKRDVDEDELTMIESGDRSQSSVMMNRTSFLRSQIITFALCA